MAARKQMVRDRADLANKLTKMEGGLSQAEVGDVRQIFKLLVNMEATSILTGRKSVVMILRREARAIAAKKRKKR